MQYAYTHSFLLAHSPSMQSREVEGKSADKSFKRTKDLRESLDSFWNWSLVKKKKKEGERET